MSSLGEEVPELSTRGRLVLGELKAKHSRRKIHLTTRAANSLKAHHKLQLEERMKYAGLWEDRSLAFTTRTGTLINPSNLKTGSFKPLLERAALPRIRFHDLRHTFTHPGCTPQMRCSAS